MRSRSASGKQALGDPRLVDVLSGAAVLNGLAPEARASLTSAMSVRDYDPGRSVYVEGEPGDTLYIVLSGKVKVSRQADDGRQVLLSVAGPSEIFGELSVLEPAPRSESATVLTHSRLALLDHTTLRASIHARSEIAEQLLRIVTRRLRGAHDSLLDLLYTDVPGRVAKALLDLAERFGAPETGGNGTRVQHDLTQRELAQLVGATRETVNKALSDFASQGWLVQGTREVIILDARSLGGRAGLAPDRPNVVHQAARG